MTIAERADSSTWDGAVAMSACADSDDPSACYRAICAGRRSGDPDLQATWALPHHRAPDADYNTAGVQNALARLPQTQGLTNRTAAESHLQAHLNSGRSQGDTMIEPVERRDAPLRENLLRAIPGVEFRASEDKSDGRIGTIHGRLAVYNQWAEIDSSLEGHFMERLAPGAFTKTFKENRSRIQVIYDHGMDPHIGRKPLGPLEAIVEDEHSVDYVAPLLDTSYNHDLEPGLRAGLYGSSYKFSIPKNKDEWDYRAGASEHNPQGLPERTVHELNVSEFGPTPFPVYDGTSAGVRSVTDDYLKRYLIRAEEPHSESDPEEPGAEPTPEPTPEPEAPAEEPTAPEPEPPPEPEAETPPLSAPEPPQEQRSMSEKMTIEERTARKGEIRSRLTEIDTQHAGEALPEGEIRSEWAALNQEDAAHDIAIADMKDRQARLLSLEGDVTRSVEVGGVTRTAPNVIKSPENVWDLTEYRKRAHGVDELPALYVEGAKRAVSDMLPLEDGQRTKLDKLFAKVDDPGELALRVLEVGSPSYFRAFGKWITQKPLTSEETRALATYTSSGADGGYAVPVQLDPTLILTDDGVANDIRSIARIETITGKEWQGVTTDAVTVSRVAENTAVTEDAPSLLQPRVVPTAVKGLIKFSIEVGQDWNSLQAEMGRLLADAKAVEESTSFITATGDGITAPQGVVGGLDAASRVTTAAGDTFAIADLFTLTGALPPRFRTARSAFLANRAVYDLVRMFGAGDDIGQGAVWVDSLQAGNPSRLVGYNAYEASSMASEVTSDDDFLLFGDFQQFIIVDRVGMSIELIPHMFDGSGNPTGTRGIWAMWRNSSAILVDNAFRLLTSAGS